MHEPFAKNSLINPATAAPAESAEAAISALFRQGLALHQQGQLVAARALYAQVLALEPQHFDALHLSGVIALQSNQPELAIDLIGRALQLNPLQAVAYSNLGLAQKKLQRLQEAIASFERAIALQPDFAAAHYNRGLALNGLRRWADALASFDRAIALQPANAEAWANRGDALEELKRLDESLASYDRAIALRPDLAEAHAYRGLVLTGLQRYAEAIDSFDRAVALRPSYIEPWCNRGIALNALHRYEEAIASYDRAIALMPDFAEGYGNRALSLRMLQRPQEALADLNRALALRPHYPKAQWSRALALLQLGQYRQGWQAYEVRWHPENFSHQQRPFAQPLWLGQEAVAGKTVLLHSEQGMGDSIQFCRYAKQVKALGATVLLDVPQELAGLLQTVEGVDACLVTHQPLPPFDLHCPLLSLPLACKTELDSIPSPGPYLHANPAKQAVWEQRLAARDQAGRGLPGHGLPGRGFPGSGLPGRGLRVGLVWSGQRMHDNDHYRNLPLQLLLQHLPVGPQYVSLQKEVRDSDLGALQTSSIQHFGDQLHDFSDTAALCALMDIVVSVDTSVAHLAGALGRPTWVLLHFAPDWRWLLEREDSPWYASVRLFRQGPDRQWAAVLGRVAYGLRRMAKPLASA